MFGTYRLILALLVLLKHFKTTEVCSGLAVWAFFILSGYLITNALNTRYGFTRTGLTEFCLNRALRLFPTYWLSVVLALLSVAAFGHLLDPRSVNSSLGVPETALEWISAVFISGGTFLGLGRLNTSPSPSSWAIDVEILMYGCSIWWLSRSWEKSRATLLWCSCAFPVLYAVSKLLMYNGEPELARSLIYSFLPVALIPYSLGVCLWYYKRRSTLKANMPALKLVVATAGFFACALLLRKWSVTASFLVALPILGCITILVSSINIGSAFSRWDKFFGHMSYPVYLLHAVGNYVALVLGELAGASTFLAEVDVIGLRQTTLPGFLVVAGVTVLLSAIVAWCFEAPIDARRRDWSARLSATLLRATRKYSPRAEDVQSGGL